MNLPRFHLKNEALRLLVHGPVALLLASAWALTSAAQAPAELARDLESFFQRSSDADDLELEALSRSFNLHQLPAVAAGLAWAERSGNPTPDAYEALVRWQFWMGKNLDPENYGMWSVARRGLDGRPLGRRVSAGVAATELQQLRALARMAQHRAHSVDALAWWRDHRLLRRRLLGRLFDPTTGMYGDADSLGRRLERLPGLASVAAIGAGAPSINESTLSTARALLALSHDARPDALQLAVSVDPRSGWGQGTLAGALGPDLFAFYLLRAVGDAQGGDLHQELRAALSSHGLESLEARVRLGSLELDIPAEAFDPWPFERTRSALNYLSSAELVPLNEARDLAALLPAPGSTAVADSVANKVLAALARWRRTPLEPKRRQIVRDTDEDLLPPNGSGLTAFRYSKRDLKMWAEEALQAMTEDLLEYYLRPDRESPYEGTLGRSSFAAGIHPTLTVHARSSSDVPDFDAEGWSARWSDGIVVRPGEPIQFETVDFRTWSARLPAPPDELGVWWLIATNGKHRLRHAPGLSVVEPVVSRVRPVGSPAANGTQNYELEVRNNVDHPLELNFTLQHPESWELQPADVRGLRIGPDTSSAVQFQLRPSQELGPGAFPTQWTVRRDGRVIHSEERMLAVPYQWIWLGGFRYDNERGIRRSGPRREIIDLGGSFKTLQGNSTWEHLPPARILPEGWVEIVPASAPAGVYFALTALSSESREIVAHVEANNEIVVEVNGDPILICEDLRREDRADANLRFGNNHVLVRMRAGGGVAGRFRLTLDEPEGTPLRAVENRLERLMDDYAYLSGSAAEQAEKPKEDRYIVIPIVYHNRSAKSVSVVGNFNGWSPTATPMVQVEPGKWKAEIRLTPGEFEYKLAIEGKRWITDPNNRLFTADGFGGRNSLLKLE